MHLRAKLMIEVEAILKARNMPHMEAAALFGVPQPRVSDLLVADLISSLLIR